MNEADEQPRVILVHDGELGFVRDQLRELAPDFVERVGSTSEEDRAADWAVIVASTTRIREFANEKGCSGVRVAVLTEDSRTLRAMLQRLGVNLMVRQPVHPSAFRLLMLRALYSGPERRRASRSSIGAAVRAKVGLRNLSGVLLDLSRTGCRLLLDVELAAGKSLRVILPPEIAGGKKLALKATVVRSRPQETESGDRFAVGVRFEDMKPDVRRRLDEVLKRHLSGPAIIEGGARANAVAVPRPGSVAPQRPLRSREEMRAASAATREKIEAANSGVEQRKVTVAPSIEIKNRPDLAGHPSERRAAERRAYEKRVIGLSDEAARVLIGKDLSHSGMRVDADSDVVIGDRMRIALHVRSGEVPLVVRSRVTRDDGERGLVVQFEQLTDADRNYLDKMVESLPVLEGEPRGDAEQGGGVVVTEILERN